MFEHVHGFFSLVERINIDLPSHSVHDRLSIQPYADLQAQIYSPRALHCSEPRRGYRFVCAEDQNMDDAPDDVLFVVQINNASVQKDEKARAY